MNGPYQTCPCNPLQKHLCLDPTALAKRVEELEGQLQMMLGDDGAKQLDALLAVVEAARKYVNDAGADIMELADALAAFDKEE